MLDVAVSLVHQQGISAELDDLAFDQIVQEAGVPRDSAYRRWPKLHKFYGEVLLELASGTTLPVTESAIAEPAGAIVLDRIEHLGTAQGRRNVVVEMFRVAIGADYDSIVASPEWNTFAALVACHQGIADDDIRDAVAAELAATEDRYVLARARVYAQLSAILGYRLVPPLAGPDGFELMSRAAGALMTGVLARVAFGDRSLDAPGRCAPSAPPRPRSGHRRPHDGRQHPQLYRARPGGRVDPEANRRPHHRDLRIQYP